ncbi:MAG: selenide, water dikinase SelD [Thiomicrospira sp.]|uniref:selenide, water dikinase SelD n=1 Tax=Thiomicrospira sp. TaxID=935 RepID=UPI0019FE0033|nr:selenide, water dikinase SelD [Thiomicrospira sp.]MBE0494393.1 selenide, water dikinase SelD [Thiomicrospira sp.]
MSTSQTAQTLIRLTEFSHGAGCGCKIAPQVLDQILKSQLTIALDPNLLVGNQSKDDAAVYDLGNGSAVISTTDFFMPIVDDAFEFGQIAATNAISDIYAMGGRPLMAIAILGWPIDKLSADVAQNVVDGGRKACQLAGIPLAGGHSIDSPEPIFGLAVTGLVEKQYIKRNDTAKAGCQLYLTKPLGIGILTTAEKHKKLKPEHQRLAPDTMCQLNKIGTELGKLPGIKAMTDVTGFGLLGHLIEMCQGSQLSAQIDYQAVPKLPHIESYLAQGCTPGGAQRNYESFAHLIGELDEMQQKILCDPQTSGGLLVAVDKAGEAAFLAVALSQGLSLEPIGVLLEKQGARLIEVI